MPAVRCKWAMLSMSVHDLRRGRACPPITNVTLRIPFQTQHDSSMWTSASTAAISVTEQPVARRWAVPCTPKLRTHGQAKTLLCRSSGGCRGALIRTVPCETPAGASTSPCLCRSPAVPAAGRRRAGVPPCPPAARQLSRTALSTAAAAGAGPRPPRTAGSAPGSASGAPAAAATARHQPRHRLCDARKSATGCDESRQGRGDVQAPGTSTVVSHKEMRFT